MISYSFTYTDLEFFLLVFVRVTCFVYIAPFFSMTNTPRNVRIALSMFITILLYQVIPGQQLEYQTVIGYAILVMKEAVTGLLIGFGANLCTSIVSFAGHVADMEMGLSMASMMDPTTKQSTTISGIYYNYMVMLILFLSGMHRYLLKALAETYTLIPVNGAVFDMDALLGSMLQFMADYIMCASNYTKQTLVEEGVKEDIVYIVPYGYTTKTSQVLREKKEDLVLIFCRNWGRY